jgi:uncharacterized protein YecE (DUF72 family)
MAARPGIRELYAVTNNHNLGKAPANAGMIMSMLESEKVPVPASLFAHYRKELEEFAVPDVVGQAELF